MFDTLLESRSRREGYAGGTIASASAHAAIIAVAILATAQARVRSHETPEAMRTVYFPPLPTLRPTTDSRALRKRTDTQPVTPWIDTRRIEPNLPPIDVSKAPSSLIDFRSQPITGGELSQPATAESSDRVFQVNQVEKQVALIAGGATPRYPEALRASGVEGQVMAQFVVDESGRAQADSVRFLRSDNRLFENAVMAVLPRMRFTPAEIGGRKVRQLVQMPFVFTLGK